MSLAFPHSRRWSTVAALSIAAAVGIAGSLFGKGSPQIGGFAPPLEPTQKKGLPRHPTPKKGRKIEYAPNVVLVTYTNLPGSIGIAPGGGGGGGISAQGGGGGNSKTQAMLAVEALGLVPEYKTYRRFYSRYHLTEAAIKRGETVESILVKVRRIVGVRSAEPDMAIYKDQVPNDPGFDFLWGLHNTGQDGGTPNADIDAPEAWAMLPNGPDVVVAVLDDGVDIDHPDLTDSIYRDFFGDVVGYDTANDDADPRPDDPDFEQHGTHVAGTVGATMDNAVGITGVGKRVKIMPIRMYAGQAGWMSDLADGLEYARLNGASVVNVSYNIDSFGQVLLDAVRRLDATDIIYVNSAGNNGQNMDQLRGVLKGLANNVVFVAATDRNDNLASFSNFGQTTTIAAPGVDILSTLPNENYAEFSGTSMATPHVAGAIGVMRAMYPRWNAKQIIQKLESSAKPLASLDGAIRGGRLNLRSALEYDVIPPAVPTNLNVVDRSTTTLGVVFNGTGDNGNVGDDVTYEAWASTSPITPTSLAKSTSHSLAVNSAGGTLKSVELTTLEPGTSYYIAVRARDNVGTYSQFRTIGPVTTATAAWKDSFETPGVWVASPGSTWHVIEKAGQDGTRAWTDSHAGAYSDDTDVSMELVKPITLTSASRMNFRAKMNVEEGYDFLHVETSLNGGPWVTRATFTGDVPWAQYSLPLPDVANKELKVRFRLVSDFSISEDGVVVDDVSFVPTQTIFTDAMSSAANFTLEAPFAISPEFFSSSPRALNDSPGGNYADDADFKATYKSTIDTTAYASPLLTFNVMKDLEYGWDFLDVETANGTNGSASPWTFRKAITGSSDWYTESLPLPTSPNLTFRFHFTSDFLFNFDGAVVDDVRIVGEKKDKVSFVESLVDLDGFTGSLTGRTVKVDLLDSANAVKYSFPGSVLYTATSGKAYVRFTVPVQGSYKVRVGGSPWTTKVSALTTLAVGTNSLSLNLRNGDVNGDNKINATDLTLVRAALGTSTISSNWNRIYDLTGDGRVNSLDEAIVQRNQGVNGD